MAYTVVTYLPGSNRPVDRVTFCTLPEAALMLAARRMVLFSDKRHSCFDSDGCLVPSGVLAEGIIAAGIIVSRAAAADG
jgi:hypothetical protein